MPSLLRHSKNLKRRKFAPPPFPTKPAAQPISTVVARKSAPPPFPKASVPFFKSTELLIQMLQFQSF
nr:hypothetical protein Iba_chr05aCG8830 [Ipomoea batatas]